MMAALDDLLLWWSNNPGIAVLFSMVLICVAWRFAFMAGFKLTVRRELKATDRERELEHAKRAAHLRLVAARMTDDNEAA